jgi:hypothetical protein
MLIVVMLGITMFSVVMLSVMEPSTLVGNYKNYKN